MASNVGAATVSSLAPANNPAVCSVECMPVVEEKPAANLFVACTVPSAATVMRTVRFVESVTAALPTFTRSSWFGSVACVDPYRRKPALIAFISAASPKERNVVEAVCVFDICAYTVPPDDDAVKALIRYGATVALLPVTFSLANAPAPVNVVVPIPTSPPELILN